MWVIMSQAESSPESLEFRVKDDCQIIFLLLVQAARRWRRYTSPSHNGSSPHLWCPGWRNILISNLDKQVKYNMFTASFRASKCILFGQTPTSLFPLLLDFMLN